jgi:hypothetical protein
VAVAWKDLRRCRLASSTRSRPPLETEMRRGENEENARKRRGGKAVGRADKILEFKIIKKVSQSGTETRKRRMKEEKGRTRSAKRTEI